MTVVVGSCVAVLLLSVSGHGVITKLSSGAHTACSVHAQDETCTSSNGLTLREVIPRAGNDNGCENPPGCAQTYNCDWCGLEKLGPAEYTETIAGKWWTKMPAAHWNEAGVEPINPCMSDDNFGDRGIADVAAGAQFDYSIYMNADHSGLYRWELTCGQVGSNDGTPITPWKALHKNKELNNGDTLPDDRTVGWDRAATDSYFQRTICSGAGCNYRMNDGNVDPQTAHCMNNRDDCYVEGSFQIPADTTCDGDAVLRWWWNSAEGMETYANCLDLKITGGTGTGNSTGTGIDGDAGLIAVGVVAALVFIAAVAFGIYMYYKRKPKSSKQTASAEHLTVISHENINPVQAKKPAETVVSMTPKPTPTAVPKKKGPSPPPALPPGWTVEYDPVTKEDYFFNPQTNVSSWTVPTAQANALPKMTPKPKPTPAVKPTVEPTPAARPTPEPTPAAKPTPKKKGPAPPPPLPPNWTVVYDPDTKEDYFYNSQTQESSWDVPQA